jgi:tripartite-type tricarboxylate transporter receptor subunit TctC
VSIASCGIAALVAAVVLTSAARAQTTPSTTSGQASTGAGQSYPAKAVRIIVPVQPGGGTDPQARLLGRKFQESMGQTFVIENRTGAGSMIGTEFVVRSPPDGYTLLCAASTLAGAYTLRKDLSFDLLKDLTPVGQISSAAQFLVVHSSVPVSSVKEFIALAKKQGGKMNAASGGNGSANHLTLEMLKQRAGIQATHIPYKGSGPATVALISGEVDFSFAGALTSMPHLRAGKIKALAVTTPKPSPLVPDAPPLMTLFPGFESTNWYAVFAPAGTPAAIVNKISTEIAKAIQLPDVREFMAREGADAVGSTPSEFAAFFKNEVDRYASVIRSANIRAD